MIQIGLKWKFSKKKLKVHLNLKQEFLVIANNILMELKFKMDYIQSHFYNQDHILTLKSMNFKMF